MFTLVVYSLADNCLSKFKGKGSSIGVGRGRAVAMRARVSSLSA